MSVQKTSTGKCDASPLTSKTSDINVGDAKSPFIEQFMGHNFRVEFEIKNASQILL